MVRFSPARSKPIEKLEKDSGASEEGEMSAGTQGEIRVGPSHQVHSTHYLIIKEYIYYQ